MTVHYERLIFIHRQAKMMQILHSHSNKINHKKCKKKITNARRKKFNTELDIFAE